MQIFDAYDVTGSLCCAAAPQQPLTAPMPVAAPAWLVPGAVRAKPLSCRGSI